MADGFGVEVDEVIAAATRVADAVAPADGVQLGIHSGAAYGGTQVHGAVTRFCATWQLALAQLAERGRATGATLAVIASVYSDGEDTACRNVAGVLRSE